MSSVASRGRSSGDSSARIQSRCTSSTPGLAATAAGSRLLGREPRERRGAHRVLQHPAALGGGEDDVGQGRLRRLGRGRCGQRAQLARPEASEHGRGPGPGPALRAERGGRRVRRRLGREVGGEVGGERRVCVGERRTGGRGRRRRRGGGRRGRRRRRRRLGAGGRQRAQLGRHGPDVVRPVRRALGERLEQRRADHAQVAQDHRRGGSRPAQRLALRDREAVLGLGEPGRGEEAAQLGLALEQRSEQLGQPVRPGHPVLASRSCARLHLSAVNWSRSDGAGGAASSALTIVSAAIA